MSVETPAGVALKEGYLTKRSRESTLLKNWRRRYFRLYPGELVYYNTPQDATPRRQLPLGLDTKVWQTNDQGYAHCFVVKAAPTAENFYIQAETEAEKADWATAVFTAARQTTDVSPVVPPIDINTKLSGETVRDVPKPPASPSRVLLQLTVIEARELPAADAPGKSDPYCVISLMNKEGQIVRSEEMKTNYITSTLTPVWNQHFTMGKAVDLSGMEALHVEVWDHNDFARNSTLGVVNIPLSIFQMSPASISQSELVDHWFRLEPRTLGSSSPRTSPSRRDKQDKEEMLKSFGELHVAMTITGSNLVDFFQSMNLSVFPQNRIVTEGIEHTDNRLEVTVLAAKDLIAADFNHSSDPFVELALLDDKGKPLRGESYRTAIKYKTRNPSWENEHHVFGRFCRIDEAAVLHVRVVDWDRSSHNDPLGCVKISLDQLSAHHQTDWFPLQPEPGMSIRDNLGAIQMSISLIGETRGERKRQQTIAKEMRTKVHGQSVEQLELENAQYLLHEAVCQLDGGKIACATEDYQVLRPQFYGINGCIHHLNAQLTRAQREKKTSDESFQARAGLEGQSQLQVTVVGTQDLQQAGYSTSINPYAIIEIDPVTCVEECQRTSAPLSPQKSKRLQALNQAATDSRNRVFSKRAPAEVSPHRAKLARNEVRSERRLDIETSRPMLKVKVLSGHGLTGVDIGGYSDPYCTLTLTDRVSSTQVEVEKKRTAVVSRTLNPVWTNEEFIFGENYPLSNADTLLIHVKSSGNIKRSTPLGRVEIALADLCHLSATSTSISSTAKEARYRLSPEPWMKKRVENLGELCIKTEVIGDATLLAEMLQRSPKRSPEKLLSFLSMSSFGSELQSSDTLANIGTTTGITAENEDFVTEIIEKGKPYRTSTATGSSAKWRSENFSFGLSYAGIFGASQRGGKDRYELHVRVFGARNLLGSHAIDTSTFMNRKRAHETSTNAFFTVIPVTREGQSVNQEKAESLTVYCTQNPNWPDHNFVFGTHQDVSTLSYLSLHVYTRDTKIELTRPISELLSSDEKREEVRIKRSQIYKVSPSGAIEDDGLVVLEYDQRVLAMRRCAGGGRFCFAHVRQYLPCCDDEYVVEFEDGFESIDDIRSIFSVDVKGKISAMHDDGSADVFLIDNDESSHAWKAMQKNSLYEKRVPLLLLTPVDTFTAEIEEVMAGHFSSQQLEEKRRIRLKHSLTGIEVAIESISGLLSHVKRPCCILTLIRDSISTNKASSIQNEVRFSFASKNDDGSVILEEKLWTMGQPVDETNQVVEENHEHSNSNDHAAKVIEERDVLEHTIALLIQVVDQDDAAVPQAAHHSTVGFVRVDLATLSNGRQQRSVRLVPPENVPYHMFVGSMSLRIECVDAGSQHDASQRNTFPASLNSSNHGFPFTPTVCGAIEWFKRCNNNEQSRRAQVYTRPKREHSRIALRKELRSALTPAQNAQIDAFHTVLVTVMRRIVSIMREIELIERYENLPEAEMPKFRQVHTINADPNSVWLGRLIHELDVETRKDIVANLEMELLDLAVSDMQREIPRSNLSRDEWIRLRELRQKELQKFGSFFMKQHSGLIHAVSCCFVGSGMVSWICRKPAVLWKDEWAKYCRSSHLKESCKLNWEDDNKTRDQDALSPPQTHDDVVVWLSALSAAGYIENVTPGFSLLVSHKSDCRVENKSDCFYRIREVERWMQDNRREASLNPLDLVREEDCYSVADSVMRKEPTTRAKQKQNQSSPTVSPQPKSQSAQNAISPLPSVTENLSTHKKTYSKKLTDHIEGVLGLQNALSSLLFSFEDQKQPAHSTAQQLVPEGLLWSWKYCLFLPSTKCMYIYEHEVSSEPTIIVNMNSSACHAAFNIAHGSKEGWFNVIDATLLQKCESNNGKYRPISDEVRDKMMKTREDGSFVMEFKTNEAQHWVHALIRAGIHIDMQRGQLVVWKRLNPIVLQQKCIENVTDFDPNDLDGSFNRLLNRFYSHDTERSRQQHEENMRQLRSRIRSEVKKPGSFRDPVMASYGMGQRRNPPPTNEKMFTRGALFSGSIIRIRTPFTDPQYPFKQTYKVEEAPLAMKKLLKLYNVEDKISWIRLPKSLRDVLLLYDVEYRHAHEVIIEEGMMREHIRTDDGDLDPIKVEERCTDLNLIYKPSDLEDCVTRMMLHVGGRKPLGCVKIPVKLVPTHRILDGWYDLAPDNEMVQRVQLGQVRVQLQMVEIPWTLRSKKLETMLWGNALYDLAHPLQNRNGIVVSAARAKAQQKLKEKRSGHSTQAVSSEDASKSGFSLSKERTFIKVTVLEGRKLIVSDILTSDPFVTFVLVRENDDKEEYTKLKTDWKPSTLNPKWQNQEFVLGATEATMLSDKKALVLRVMDYDSASSNDPMGCIRLDLQRDKSGRITGLMLVHADSHGDPTKTSLALDEHNRVEVFERLMTDERGGQLKISAARGNDPDVDGRLGRLRFVVQLMENENFVDPNAMNALSVASTLRSLETKFSLEVSLTSIEVVKAPPSFKADWTQYYCVFNPQGDGGRKVNYDVYTEDLGSENVLPLSSLLDAGSTSAGGAKILGRTYDISTVASFEVIIISQKQGRSFKGFFADPGQIKNCDKRQEFPQKMIVLTDRDDKNTEIHLHITAKFVAVRRGERLQRLLAETFRLVGQEFDSRSINSESVMSVEDYLRDVCKTASPPKGYVPGALLAQVHQMKYATKVHWCYTPQLLGFCWEYVFSFGSKDRLSYEDGAAMDCILEKWNRVLQRISEAKNQLTGHLHGFKTPQLLQALLSDCDWSGFSLSLLSSDGTEGGTVNYSSAQSFEQETHLKPHTKVDVWLDPIKHSGVAVDARLDDGTFVAGTIVDDDGVNNFDVAFCSGVKNDTTENHAEDELPPLSEGQEVFVCPAVQGNKSTDGAANDGSLHSGQSGKVLSIDPASHADAPYLIGFETETVPNEEWLPRVCLDAKFDRLLGNDIYLQLPKGTLVYVSAKQEQEPSKGTAASRQAKILRNCQTARYNVQFVDGKMPFLEENVERHRLQMVESKMMYEGEVMALSLLSTAKDTFARYKVLLTNGDIVNNVEASQVREHSDNFASDTCVLASVFSSIKVDDAPTSGEQTADSMGERIRALWGSDHGVKVFVLLRKRVKTVNLRDNVTREVLDDALPERNESAPRFIEQCHGYIKCGDHVKEKKEQYVLKPEFKKIVPLLEQRPQAEWNEGQSADAEAVLACRCTCFYFAPEPRITISGMLHISPSVTISSRQLFSTLASQTIKDRAVTLQMIQRLVRGIASVHMPLNRKERSVQIKSVDFCFYRKPMSNVSISTLMSTCSGEFVEAGSIHQVSTKMNSVPIKYVSIRVGFEISVPHNDCQSLADALKTAMKDAERIKGHLSVLNKLDIRDSVIPMIGMSKPVGNASWSFFSPQDAGSTNAALTIEMLNPQATKGSAPTLSIELLPLRNQYLCAECEDGTICDICLPMERILSEAQLRHRLMPWFEAKIVECPSDSDQMATRTFKEVTEDAESRRSSVTKTLTRQETAALPGYRVMYLNSGRPESVPQNLCHGDIRFDTLQVRVLQASQLALKQTMGDGAVVAEILLEPKEFEVQIHDDNTSGSSFGTEVSETGEIRLTAEKNSVVTLSRKRDSLDWCAGKEVKTASYGHPSVDLSCIKGITVNLWSMKPKTKTLIGRTFIRLEDIPIRGHNSSISDETDTSSTSARDNKCLGIALPKSKKVTDQVSEQTFSVYRKHRGKDTVVGKISVALERILCVEPGDIVLARRFTADDDAWVISDKEILKETKLFQQDHVKRAMLSTFCNCDNFAKQELHLQCLLKTELLTTAMQKVYTSTQVQRGGNTTLSASDGNTNSSQRVIDQLKQVIENTVDFVGDTVTELGLHGSSRRLPWSAEKIKKQVGSERHELISTRPSLSDTTKRLRRTMLKLYRMYCDRLIPKLQRLYDLDKRGDDIDIVEAEQLLSFLEEEVEDLDFQDETVRRSVYGRVRLVKVAQVLRDIMRTTIRVTVMNADGMGDDQIGTAFIPLIDLLDQVEHNCIYDLDKTTRLRGLTNVNKPLVPSSPSPSAKEVKQGKVHLKLCFSYSEASLLEQATQVYKSLKAKFVAQHEDARLRINAAVVPAQRRRWMTMKMYLDELEAQSQENHGKLHWERTPLLLNLVWDIFTTPQDNVKADNPDDEVCLRNIAESAVKYRSVVENVHQRWVNLQPMLEELLQTQRAVQIDAHRTPMLLDHIEKEVEGLDLVLNTAWHQVNEKWTNLFNALEQLVAMKDRKLHMTCAPQLLRYVEQYCSKGLSEIHAEAVSTVQFRWMAITQDGGPLCELRLMEKKCLHWRRTHEVLLLLTQDCEGFADVDAKTLEIVQKRWEQVQEWLNEVVVMQSQHMIDCEATPFILKKIGLMDESQRLTGLSVPTIQTALSPNPLSSSPSKMRLDSANSSSNDEGFGSSRAIERAMSSATMSCAGSEQDAGRLEGMDEWYAIEETRRELARIPNHRICTDDARKNWLPYSRDGKDTRLVITHEDILLTPRSVRMALIDRGVIPQTSVPDEGLFTSNEPAETSSRLRKELTDEIAEFERAIDQDESSSMSTTLKWNPERVAELYLIIESLGKSDLLWKIQHAVNINKELEVPTSFAMLLEEMKIRQIPTTEIEGLARALTVLLQKRELAANGVSVPANANFTEVLALMHRHQVHDVALPPDTAAVQALLQEHGLDRTGEAVFLRGMRIGTQIWKGEKSSELHRQDDTRPRDTSLAASINTGLGLVDTQIEVLRKKMLIEALQKRNSLAKTFPAEIRICEDEMADGDGVDMSGDYMTLIVRFQQLLIHESYTMRLAEYAALDRCMRALLHVPRDQVVTKQDIALGLQPFGPKFRLPIEAFTTEELIQAAQERRIRTPNESILAQCPKGQNAQAMAFYAAVHHAAMVFQQLTSFRARVDPISQRLADALPFDDTCGIEGMSIPKRRGSLDFKHMVSEWLLGSEESVFTTEQVMTEYYRQRLQWAAAASTLNNRWFHCTHGWCDDVSKGVGVKILLQKLLIFETANKMHMLDTEKLLQEVNDKCINLRKRERAAKEALEKRFQANLEMLEKLVGFAEKCINNRRLHTEATPALLHAIEQFCIVPQSLRPRHREAYHVVTSAWLPHRERLAELVKMQKEGTFSIVRTPELLNEMEFHTEGIAGADELEIDDVISRARASSAPVEEQEQFVVRKADEIRLGQRKQLSLRLDLDRVEPVDAVLEAMKNEDATAPIDWQSLSPSKRVVQPLFDAQTSPRHERRASWGEEFMTILRSPSKWLMARNDTSSRIPDEYFFPPDLTLETSKSTDKTPSVTPASPHAASAAAPVSAPASSPPPAPSPVPTSATSSIV